MCWTQFCLLVQNKSRWFSPDKLAFHILWEYHYVHLSIPFPGFPSPMLWTYPLYDYLSRTRNILVNCLCLGSHSTMAHLKDGTKSRVEYCSSMAEWLFSSIDYHSFCYHQWKRKLLSLSFMSSCWLTYFSLSPRHELLYCFPEVGVTITIDFMV